MTQRDNRHELGTQDNNDWIEWHGGECPVAHGTLVDVRVRGGRKLPLRYEEVGIPAGQSLSTPRKVRAVDWSCYSGEVTIIAYRLHQPEQEPSLTIEQLLAKANKHAAKAAKHEAKRCELFAQAAELVPAGYVLREKEGENAHECDRMWIKPDGPIVKLDWHTDSLNMQDPANWKAGDVVEWTELGLDGLTRGRHYTLDDAEGWLVVIRDDDGCERELTSDNFKWISRV